MQVRASRRALLWRATTVLALGLIMVFGLAGTAMAVATGAHITGTVTAEPFGGLPSGAPLAGITVNAYTLVPDGFGDFYWDVAGSATTDGSGVYDIGNLSEGSYRLEFDGDSDYLGECYNNVPGTDVSSEGVEDIPLATNQVKSGYDAALAALSHITGTVTADNGGDPIEGVSVRAYALTEDGSGGLYWEPAGYASTDTDGAYDLQVPKGTYRILFYGDSNYLAECYNDVPGSDVDNPACTSVEVGYVVAHESVDGIDASLAPAGHVTGTVTAETGGGPLEGMWVTAYKHVIEGPDASYWDWAGDANTDPSGAYDIGGLTPGTYRLWFQGNSDYAGECYNNVPTDNISDARCTGFDVASGATVPGKDAALSTASHITGNVTAETGGAPIDMVAVSAFALIDDGMGGTYWTAVGSATTDISGAYDINGLRAGTYRLVFYGTESYLGESYNNVPTTDASDVRCAGIAVGTAETVSGKNAALATASHITGTVTAQSDGSPIDGAYVEAYEQVDDGTGGWVWLPVSGAVSDVSGHYNLGGLRAGTYRLRFTDFGVHAAECYNNVPGDNVENPACTGIPVGTAATVSGKNAALEGISSIMGTVTAKDSGALLEGIRVTAWLSYTDASGATRWEPCSDALTDSHGSYDITGLSAGAYRLSFEDDTSAYASQCYDGVPGQDVADAACSSIAVAPAAIVSGKNASLVVGSHVTGKVTADGSGASLEGIQVRAYLLHTDGSGRTFLGWGGASVTSTSGTYDIPGLPAGSYRLTFNDSSSGYSNDLYSPECYNNVPGLNAMDPACASVSVGAGASVLDKDAGLALKASDVTAPSVPSSVHVTAKGTTSVSLAWNASSDSGSGVAKYKVFRNGVFIGDNVSPEYTDSGLTPGTSYTFTVSAVDNAKNESAKSTGLQVATDKEVVTGPVVTTGNSSVTIDLGGGMSVTVGLNAATTGSIRVIALSQAPAAPASGFQILGTTYDISYTGTVVPGSKYTITLPYDASVSNAVAAGIKINHWHNGAWEVITPKSIDFAAHTVTFESDSLSPFAVVLSTVVTPPVVTPAPTPTSLSAASLSPSKPTRKKATTFSAVISPVAAAGSGSATLRLYQQQTKYVKKKVKGKTKKVKVTYWKLRNTAGMTGNATTGKFSASVKTKYAGKWKMEVTYNPGTGFAACAPVSKSFTVK